MTAPPRDADNRHTEDATPDQKARLLSRMDVTMVQKLAFAGAHFQLHDGARILDIGCARGKGSYHIAALNPRLQVVGVDYDADYIEEAKRTYQLPNLTFVQGDARKLHLEGEKFDAILNSSVMHEIYSFSDYSLTAVEDALKSELELLKPGGVILLRDFMRAANPDSMVYLDLPPEEAGGDTPETMSTADLLKLYSQHADAMKPEGLRGFFLEETGTLPDGWRRFYLSKDRAYEFIWRKEYRARFHVEAREKYSYWTAEDFRKVPETMGARVVYTAPYYNPWITRHWNDGKFRLFDEKMNPLPAPPSNFIAIIRKTEEGESLRLGEHRAAPGAPAYLKLEHLKNRETGGVYDIVSRPGAVYDVLPYGRNKQGNLVVYAKSAYPRPLINIHARQMTPNIDGRTWSGHMVEPLTIGNQRGAATAVRRALIERGGFAPKDVGAVAKGLRYYTAPADVNEKVSSLFVAVSADDYERNLPGHFSGFSSDGTLRAFDVQDLLRGVQVGMLAEARLEMNIYALLHKTGVAPQSWIGDKFEIAQASLGGGADISGLLNARRRVFDRTKEKAGYLKVLRSVFIDQAQDKNGDAKLLAAQELEFAVPDRGASRGRGDISTNSVMAIPVVRDQDSGEIMMGVQLRDFPAVQAQEGQSALLTVPGFRLPSSVRDRDQARDYVCTRIPGLRHEQAQALGESYFPSMGILPGRIFPYLVTSERAQEWQDGHFVKLRDLFANLEKLHDAHLILAVCRTVHALGLWEEYSRKPAPKIAQEHLAKARP